MRAFVIDAADNVATALDDLAPGPVDLLGAGAPRTVEATEPIRAAHKIALTKIAAGEAVIKYGLPIGHAIAPIGPGTWVHLHNTASNYDDRSGSLEVESGAPTDTAGAYV